MTRDMLLEIGTEELPAAFIGPALATMHERAARELNRLRLDYADIATYGTPRRLALHIRGLAAEQAEMIIETKGPSKRVAFAPDGTPTKAALGFARGQGVDVSALEVRPTDQGEYVFAVTRQQGEPAAAVLARWLPEFITGIPFPKSMRWGTGTLRFARPIRWLVALLGQDVLPVVVDGVRADRETVGHRFLAPEPFPLGGPDEYVERLRERHVLVDGAERQFAVQRCVEEAATASGGRIVDDGSLLAEVTNLVEYPAAIVGRFADEFLQLPEEVLTTPMREHQRYFPLSDGEGRLLPSFVAVSNGPRPDPDVIRRGNEKVLAARLADARFFYEEDNRQPLRTKVDGLRDVVFQQQLGTVYDKMRRVQKLAHRLSEELTLDDGERAAAQEGAYLAKADLVTLMVHEFPELQGIIGREYARLSGESDGVADVIYEHHLPRHATDGLPKTAAGRVVSIADKIDTIVGCFGVGLIPTGSQDPYALRRQALGVVRIVLDSRLSVHLTPLLQWAYDLYEVPLADRAETMTKVLDFFRQRLRGLLLEEGIRHDVADAVLAVEGDRPASVAARAKALQRFTANSEFPSLLTAYERVANLAKHSARDDVDPSLFEAEAEHALLAAVEDGAVRLPQLLQEGSFDQAFSLLAGLGPAVDKLFDDVMVMAPKLEVRDNRLGLLQRTKQLFDRLARFDLVVTS